MVAPPTRPFAYKDEDLAAAEDESDTDNSPVEAVGGLELSVRLVPVDRSNREGTSKMST